MLSVCFQIECFWRFYRCFGHCAAVACVVNHLNMIGAGLQRVDVLCLCTGTPKYAVITRTPTDAQINAAITGTCAGDRACLQLQGYSTVFVNNEGFDRFTLALNIRDGNGIDTRSHIAQVFACSSV